VEKHDVEQITATAFVAFEKRKKTKSRGSRVHISYDCSSLAKVNGKYIQWVVRMLFLIASELHMAHVTTCKRKPRL